MNDADISENPARGQAGSAVSGKGNGSRLLRRTFLVAFILVSGGLITSGAVELFFRYRESVEGIGALQHEMAQGVAFKIQQFVQDIEKTLRASTQTPEIVSSGLTEAYRFQLIKLLREAPAITTATAVDANGGERLKVSRVQMVRPEDLKDRSSDKAFVQARKGESFFSPVYFVRHSEPYMRIAVPIERFAKDVIGVLIAEVNLKYIWEVISQIKVGKTGYAYVVSRDGDLIAHPDISLVLQKRSLKSLSQVQAALTGTPGPFVAQPNLAGQQVFPAYASIPDLGWAVLVERPAGEAYAPLYSSMLRTAILLLLGLGFAILASLLIGRRVVRPVQVLREGAARIGAGALNHRIDVRTGDELQALAEEFNDMAARLQESYAGLEQKVEERTRALARLVEELQALSEVSQAVSSTLDLQTVLTTIVTRAAQLSGANGGAIYEYDETAQAFDLRATHGAEAELMQALQAEPIPLGESALGRAALSRAPVQVPDILDEQIPVLARIRTVLVRSSYHSLLALPLLIEQRIMGGLVVWRQEPGSFPTGVVNLLQTFASQSTLAIQNAQLFREIEARGRELEIASKHKSQFLANMSHEIRTPMNAIMGMTHLALQTELSPKQNDYLDKIKTSANSLLGIINDILDFSKIEAGKMDLESVDFSLDDVINNLAPLMTIKFQEKKSLEVLFDIASNIPRFLKGDPLRLGQVLINLANNAVKFTEEGEIVIAARLVEEKQHKVTLEFTVSDTGIGLSREQIDNLFKAFSQADTSTTRLYGGTGLGLTICKRLVEMMGGEMRVASAPGQGSTFIFTAVYGRSDQKKLQIMKPPPDLKGLRVLVVDDNATAREILKGMLVSFGFKVSLAADGEEGLQLLEKDSQVHDLVLMDWRMPGLNGIEVARRIKNHPGLAKIPTIIMVTAYGREDIMRQADQIDLEGFLIKPVSASVLFDTIMLAFGKEAAEISGIEQRKEQKADVLKHIQGARVLLVEDNEINQEVARELLEGAGLPVTIATNGQEAVRAVKENNFEAVLMDVQMPVMDGYEATRKIREWEVGIRMAESEKEKSEVGMRKLEKGKDSDFKSEIQTPKSGVRHPASDIQEPASNIQHPVPIIAMTAHAMVEDRTRCLEAGMNDYVSKPIEPERLFLTLCHWIKPGKRAIPDYLLARKAEELPGEEPLPLAGLPGLSVKTGLSKVGSNRKLYHKLLAKFHRNYTSVADDIRNALRKNELETATRLTHTIKGLAGNIGARDLHRAAVDLEEALRQDRNEDIAARLEAFSGTLEQVMSSIAALEIQKSDPAENGPSAEHLREAIDSERVFIILNELRGLLEEDDFRAVRSLENLRAAFPNWIDGDELDDLEKHIGGYDFEKALKTLSVVEQILNDKLN